MKKVAVIDSGSGGLNVLKELFHSSSGCQFLFLADEKNAHYGNKSKAQLQQIACDLVDLLNLFFKPDVIVFACNTLTSAAIDHVRKTYPEITFIGCEPAIKPAREKYAPKDILLLATPTTIKECKLLKKYEGINAISIDSLPSLIDNNLFDLDSLIPYLEENIAPFSPKAIVLGCTHFEAIKNQIAAFSDAELFGSSHGISKRLQEFCHDAGGNDCSFMTTGDGGSLPAYFHYLTKND